MKFNKLIYFVPVFIFLNYCNSSSETENVDYNDFSQRTYKLHLPWSYSADKSHPLIFAFHGAYSSGLEMQSITGFNSNAGLKGYFVCYPDAAVENWNEGCDCNKPHRLGIDDIGFVEYLINKITSEYSIDTNRIYAAGYSQGGLFAMNVACKLSGKFAAAATVASTMSVPLSENCYPENKISILMIHGTFDSVIPWNGLESGQFSLLSAENAISYWANLNSCNLDAAETILPDNGEPYISVTKKEFQNCAGNSETVLYAVNGGGHEWFANREIDATEVILEFLLEHSK